MTSKERDECIAKAQAALEEARAQLKKIVDDRMARCGTVGVYGHVLDEVQGVQKSLRFEVQQEQAWAFHDSVPYYGG